VSLLGTVLPFFAGTAIDRFGPVRVSLIINLAVLLGSIQLAVSAYFDSYGWMISGEVFFGMGSGVLSVIQEAILSKWFRDKNLSTVIGLKLSVTRLVQFIGNIACQPLIASAGNWAWGFYLSMILCALSMVINVVFAFMMWRLGYVTATGKQVIEDEVDESRRIRWSAPLFFPLVYWLAPWMELTISSVWSSFEDQAT
jgi:MFS family permease